MGPNKTTAPAAGLFEPENGNAMANQGFLETRTFWCHEKGPNKESPKHKNKA